MLFSDIFRVNKLIFQRVSNISLLHDRQDVDLPGLQVGFVTRIPMVISWEFHRGMVIVCYCYLMNNIHLISLDYRCILCHPFIFGLHAGYPGFDPYVYIYTLIQVPVSHLLLSSSFAMAHTPHGAWRLHAAKHFHKKRSVLVRQSLKTYQYI